MTWIYIAYTWYCYSYSTDDGLLLVCTELMGDTFDMNMRILHVHLLALRRGHVVPLPADVLGVGASGATEHSPQRGRGQLLRHLPDEALRVVGEEHEPLVPVDVERRQQPVPRLLPHLLLEHAAEVGHLCWHGVVDVDGVVDLVLGAAALLHRAEVLLVALETDRVVRFPHAASPRAGLAAVDVERGLVGAAVTLRTRLVLVLEHLDTCVRLPEVRPHEPLRPGEGVVEVLLGGVVLVARPAVVLPDE